MDRRLGDKQLQGNSAMFDRAKVAHIICEAAELSGFSGKRWAILANLVSLYVDLVESIRQEIARFGYSALPVVLQGQHEVCRMEGEAIIVVVERVIENGNVGYDTSVCCRESEMRAVICDALKSIVTKYAEGDIAAVEQFLTATGIMLAPKQEVVPDIGEGSCQ